MSNDGVVNDKEVKVGNGAEVEDMTSDLRADDFKLKLEPDAKDPMAANKPTPSFVKPVLHVEKTGNEQVVLTADQVIAISKLVEERTRATISESGFDASMAAQVVPKGQVPITDFSKMTLDDVYDLSVPIEAKPFMSADVLTISLKDTNYEARWVNKNPQNLGDKIAKGFTFIEPKDLRTDVEKAIQTGKDGEGHYSFNDVVAMKIDKATYYRALRAAHERAVSTTNSQNLHKRAAAQANEFMSKSEAANDFNSARRDKKMEFYDPAITVG